MSQEIALSYALRAAKGGESINSQASLSLNLTGSEMIGAVYTISTTPAAVPIGSCDQIQVMFIKNMPYLADGTTANTATVTVGLDNPPTQLVSVLPPGGWCVLMGLTTAPYYKASAGTPDVFVAVMEN